MENTPTNNPGSSEPISDADAIRQISSGDTNAFEFLVLKYQQMVYGTAWNLLHDSTLAEDATQEAFLLAFQHLKSLRKPERFGPWLHRISKNVAIRAAKLANRERVAILATTYEEVQQPSAMDPEIDLSSAIDHLPSKPREALLLFYLQGRNIAECAQYIGISESAFKTRLHRARKHLKTQLAQNELSAMEDKANKPDLTRNIMGALPATALLNKSTPLFGLLGAAIPTFISSTPTFLLVLMSHKGQLANYRSHGEIRRSIARSAALGGFLFVIIGLVLLTNVRESFGENAMYFYGGLFMLVTVPFSLDQIRISRNPFLISVSAGTLVIGIVWIFVGLDILPRTLSFTPFYFYSILLFFSRKSIPYRHDYNLFQRHCMGLLAQEFPENVGVFDKTQLTQFSRFLGSKSLVASRLWFKDGCRLYLPPVKNRIHRMLMCIPAQWQDLSFIHITYSGLCSAHICKRDQDALASMFSPPVSPRELELAVARSVSSALAQYANGDAATAATILQTEAEDETFYKPPYQVTATRAIMYLGLVGAILGLAIKMFGGK